MKGNFLARESDKRFGEELADRLVHMFRDRSAQVVENDEADYREPRPFDYAVATVTTADLYLRFVRVRGEFSVYISVPGPRPKWDAIDSALVWFDMQRGIQGRSDLPNWGQGFEWDSTGWWSSIDGFLVENWPRLKEAACASPYSRPR